MPAGAGSRVVTKRAPICGATVPSRPGCRRSVRSHMGQLSRGQLIAYALGGILLVVAAVRLLGGGADGSSASGEPPLALDGGVGATGSGGAPGGARKLYVHVAGAVRRPGLYRVAEGSRVAAAVARAGGPSRRAHVGAVNLAAPLEDGQQVVIPRRGARSAGAASASAGGSEASGTPAAAISLAEASPEELDQVEGIGPTLAKRILEYRDAHGGLRSIDELREVDGIGDKRFEALRKAVRP